MHNYERLPEKPTPLEVGDISREVMAVSDNLYSSKLWKIRREPSSDVLILTENKRPGVFILLGVLSIPFLLLVTTPLIRWWRWGPEAATDGLLDLLLAALLYIGFIVLFIGYCLSCRVTIKADRQTGRVVAVTKELWRQTVKEATNPQRFGLVFAATARWKKTFDQWWMAALTPAGIVRLACLPTPHAEEAKDILDSFFGIETRTQGKTREVQELMDYLSIPSDIKTGGKEFDALSRETLLREKKMREITSAIFWIVIIFGLFLFLFTGLLKAGS